MKIKFAPTGQEIEGNPDKTLLQLCGDNNIEIKSICKGVPSCAECRIKIVAGDHNLIPPNRAELSLIGSNYFMDGRRLACQVRCFGEVTVDLTEQIERADSPSKKVRGFRNQTGRQQETQAVQGTLVLEEKPTANEPPVRGGREPREPREPQQGRGANREPREARDSTQQQSRGGNRESRDQQARGGNGNREPRDPNEARPQNQNRSRGETEARGEHHRSGGRGGSNQQARGQGSRQQGDTAQPGSETMNQGGGGRNNRQRGRNHQGRRDQAPNPEKAPNQLKAMEIQEDASSTHGKKGSSTNS